MKKPGILHARQTKIAHHPGGKLKRRIALSQSDKRVAHILKRHLIVCIETERLLQEMLRCNERPREEEARCERIQKMHLLQKSDILPKNFLCQAHSLFLIVRRALL